MADLGAQLEQARRILAAIDETIAGRVIEDVHSYEIQTNLGTRRLDKIPMGDLLKARSYYRDEISRLEAVQARGNSPRARMVVVEF